MIRPCRWAGIILLSPPSGSFRCIPAREFPRAFTLRKRIPLGAGSGWGSSDAATVLIALDAIFETHLGTGDLEVIAARLGSDVPFFHSPPFRHMQRAGRDRRAVDIPEKIEALARQAALWRGNGMGL